MTRPRTVADEERIYAALHKILYSMTDLGVKPIRCNNLKEQIRYHLRPSSDPRTVKRHLQNMMDRRMIQAGSNFNGRNISAINNHFRISNPERKSDDMVFSDIEDLEKHAENKLQMKMEEKRDMEIRKAVIELNKTRKSQKEDPENERLKKYLEDCTHRLNSLLEKKIHKQDIS